MLTIRRDKEIHREEGGWFSARWHFSFAHYRDPANDAFGAMRVFNDDRLVPGAIWPMHPHQDVEGLTYMVEGSFRHEDSVGGAPEDEPMRFIQIWVLPDTAGLDPEVEQKVFTRQDRSGRLLRVMGPEGGEVVRIHQDASVHMASRPRSPTSRRWRSPPRRRASSSWSTCP
jgi:quercetin 2,3-dioxygenase